MGPRKTRRRGWLLHYGSEANHYYAFYRRKPDVDVRLHESPTDGHKVVLYEADGFAFQTCATGLERTFGVKFPIGHVEPFEMTVGRSGVDWWLWKERAISAGIAATVALVAAALW